MGKKRILVGYGIDLDAVSGWINTTDGSPQDPANVSRGVFGATVGLNRLLKLLDKYNIKATFFTPGHTAESFPNEVRKVHEAGHEISLHGYTHEYIHTLSETQQRRILEKSISALQHITGYKPLGYTAPAWAPSKELIPMLEEYGIKYDHSLMHHDVQPYWAPDSSSEWKETDYKTEADQWMKPMTQPKRSNVVEIPANWHLDDWPPLQPTIGRPAHGYVDPHVLESIWKETFDFAYREYDTFIFPVSIHPQVSGKAQNILMHERFIEYINKHEGVEWLPLGAIAEEFRSGKIAGETLWGIE